MAVGLLIGATVAAQPWLAQAAPGDNAIAVPGLKALNTDGSAEVNSISCSAPGDCVAVGYFSDVASDYTAFIVEQTDGTWDSAMPAPGLATLDTGGYSELLSVSCSSPGNCSTGGYYSDGDDEYQAFVVSQVDGTWSTTTTIPNIDALNTGGDAEILSVSCASSGNCSAGGFYTDTDSSDVAFLVAQTDGAWGAGIAVPGLAALDSDTDSQVESVSCSTAGNCTAGGYYDSLVDEYQVFVVSQVDGTWGTATPIPGLAALNTGADAEVDSISCTSTGSCSAGGYYTDGADVDQGFVATQVDGTWGTAIAVPGLETLNSGDSAGVRVVSCTSPGSCSAIGDYADTDGSQAFVVSQTDGTWGTAIPVPGLKVLNTDNGANGESISCVSAGNCVAGGYYDTTADGYFAYTTTQVDGTWGTATMIPGIPKLVTSNDAEANSLSCTSAGTCVAAGYYDDDDGSQGYVYELPTVPGGALQSVTPARILETRTGPNDKTEDGKFQGIGPRDAMSTTEFTVADRGGVPGNADAVMLNVTAIAPDAAGFLTVWPCTLPRPVASNVNYGPGDVAPNAVLAKLSNTGTVCIYTRAATDLIVDVNGYVPQGGSPGTVTPARILETRTGPNDKTEDGKFQGIGPRDAMSTTEFTVADRGGVPGNADAVMLNVTAIAPDAAGFLTVWPCTLPRPVASNVNYGPGDVAPNAVLAKLSNTGTVCIYTRAATELIVDVNGYVS